MGEFVWLGGGVPGFWGGSLGFGGPPDTPPPFVLPPPPQRALGSFVFLLFGGLLGAFALFTFLRVPETRGRPFAAGGPPPPRLGPPRLLQPPEKACTELQCLAGGEEA